MLYKTLSSYGVKRMTVKAFSCGTKFTLDYDDKGKNDKTTEPDIALDGWLFRTDSGGRKDLILQTPSALSDIVGPIISPLLDMSELPELFLNGERISFN